MRNGNYENLSVETVVQKLPEAREYLREARIDSTSRMSLREACAATSVNSDEMLAQIEARMRRQARRAVERTAAPAEVSREELASV
jgi:iron-sulfur cluster repair protein YtfE (RIC family)